VLSGWSLALACTLDRFAAGDDSPPAEPDNIK